MKYREIALTLLTVAALVAAAAFVTIAPAGAEAAGGIDQLELARAMRANCSVLAASGTSTAQRSRGRQCRDDQQRIIDVLLSSTPSPTLSPTFTPPPPTSTPSPPTMSAPAAGFPTPATTGVPAGWTPVTTRGSWTITSPGVYEDVRVTGSITVSAAEVTLRRVEVVGGSILLSAAACRGSGGNPTVLIEDTSIIGTAAAFGSADGAIRHGGYHARGVEISGVQEGFRVGGKEDPGCARVIIEDSYARAVPPAPNCSPTGIDWHGDALQAYDGPHLTLRHSTLILANELCTSGGGTSAYFYPSLAGNTGADVDGLLAGGGGYVFRQGWPGRVHGLRIIEGPWYPGGPLTDMACSAIDWADNAIVRVDSQLRITATVRALPCG